MVKLEHKIHSLKKSSLNMDLETIPDAMIYWMCYGKLHHRCGPAVIYMNGNVEWWLDDKEYTFDEWVNKAGLTDEQIIEMKLIYS